MRKIIDVSSIRKEFYHEPEFIILPDFYTVANTGNISKAAKELYISQPAISKSIQKLEEGVGCKLFSEVRAALS